MRWVAKVTYREPGGKVVKKTTSYLAAYPAEGGRAKQLQRSQVISDMVPKGCTTVNISIKQRRR